VDHLLRPAAEHLDRDLLQSPAAQLAVEPLESQLRPPVAQLVDIAQQSLLRGRARAPLGLTPPQLIP
jgi:hypothetical protein